MNKIKKFFLIEVSPGEEAPAPRPWTWGQREWWLGAPPSAEAG